SAARTAPVAGATHRSAPVGPTGERTWAPARAPVEKLSPWVLTENWPFYMAGQAPPATPYSATVPGRGGGTAVVAAGLRRRRRRPSPRRCRAGIRYPRP